MQPFSARALSGGQCSTSDGMVASPYQGRWRCRIADSPDGSSPSRIGRKINTSHFKQRLAPPKILLSQEREPLSIGLRPADLPASLEGASLTEGFPNFYDTTTFVAETLLPTRSGMYRVRGYRHSVDGGRTYSEPVAIITGEPEGHENVPIRVHDACFTSEVLGSLKCDCAEQLEMAMEYIQENAPGIVIYLQQEGRGIGLANKIAAYALQEEGLDTVDANRALGLPDDCREYTSVHNILADLNVKSVRLMTNNPRKLHVLEELGVKVNGRIPCLVKAQAHNLGYLATKKSRMAHFIEEHQLNGPSCVWSPEEVEEEEEEVVPGRRNHAAPVLRRPHPGRPLIPDPRHPSKQIGKEHSQSASP
eukprot:jgi/Botrbrau1/7042/Bobra.0165s0065.1